MFMGGMYELLQVIINLLDSCDKKYITTKELKEISDLSNQAIVNSLTRLCNGGFIIKRDIRNKKGFREVSYKLNGNLTFEFIRNSLYR